MSFHLNPEVLPAFVRTILEDGSPETANRVRES